MTDHNNGPAFAAGDMVTLNITDLNHRSAGVGKAEGFTFFIDGALPGEEVSAEITALHKNYGEARIVSLNRASVKRTAPPCPYYTRCGGCSLQHLSPDGQLAWKQSMVTETLRRLAGTTGTAKPVFGMENPWRYRNKAQIHIGLENSRVIAGYYSSNSRQIIDVDQCPVQHPVNEALINALRKALQSYYDSEDHEDKASLPVTGAVIRTSFAADKGVIALNASPGRTYINKMKKLATLIGAEAGACLSGIVLLHRSKMKTGITILSGQPNLVEEISPFSYQISPLSFFQVNPRQAKALYEYAASLCGSPKTVFDLYCGTGNLSLYLSSEAERVIGVDAEKAAIEDAKANAALNRITNCSFISARVEDKPDLLMDCASPVTVYLNPPRGGCSPRLIDTVATAKPERIVYVSCNPATLARDLKLLQNNGYKVEITQPVDMFPHTAHVETVTLLIR
jgi:23S rRNA (uracil1939-C5)-methyltransferase